MGLCGVVLLVECELLVCYIRRESIMAVVVVVVVL
jgi:hypothetical protein